MKKVILILLTLCLFCGLALPAYAAEDDTAIDQPIKQEQEPVVVATLEELQAAINVAEDGDIIEVSSTINMRYTELLTEKRIVLIRAEGFSKCFFALFDNSKVSGFTIVDDLQKSCMVIAESYSGNIYIENCSFIGKGNVSSNMINMFQGNIMVNGCNFIDGCETPITIGSLSDVIIENCTFSGNKAMMRGGAIQNSGSLVVRNTKISENQSCLGGGISNSGNLTLDNCVLYGNISTEDPGADIYSEGVLTIVSIAESPDNAEFYNETTGEKVDLPFESYEGSAKLICLTEEQAAEYFSPKPGDNDNNEDTPPEQPQPPQEPGDQTGDDDNATGGEQPPQEPTQPPQGGSGDNPADTTPNTPQPPQKPSDGGNSNDDYTPPIDYRPSQRPVKPSTGTKPEEDSKPQEQPDVPASTKPQLACNGAMIDTSRTVVLLGYGDGLLHENDPLTRAQLATIIYRLLDDDSIAKYSNAQLAFSDVAADAWYAPYVRVIQSAKIVNGVGGGKYNPNGTVTWAQVVTILSRFVEPQEYAMQHISYDGWAIEAIQTAAANGWIMDSADFDPDAIISRGELVRLVNGVLAMYR